MLLPSSMAEKDMGGEDMGGEETGGESLDPRQRAQHAAPLRGWVSLFSSSSPLPPSPPPPPISAPSAPAPSRRLPFRFPASWWIRPASPVPADDRVSPP